MNGIVGSKARLRVASDTGSTTGVATMILALLSAGTVATITLVGVHQLVPDVSERLRAGEPSAVRAPAKVVVTPHVAIPVLVPARETGSHRDAAKRQATSPSVVTAVPADVTSPAPRVPAHTPRVPLPPVHVDRPTVAVPAVTVPAVAVPAVTVPAVTTPAVTTPAVTVPTVTVPTVTTPAVAPPVPGLAPGTTVVNAPPVPGYPNVAPTGSRRSSGLAAYAPRPQACVPVQAEKQGRSRGHGAACDVRGGVRAGGERCDEGYGDDRRRGHGVDELRDGRDGRDGRCDR